MWRLIQETLCRIKSVSNQNLFLFLLYVWLLKIPTNRKYVLAPGPELAGEKSMHGTDCIMALFMNNFCDTWAWLGCFEYIVYMCSTVHLNVTHCYRNLCMTHNKLLTVGNISAWHPRNEWKNQWAMNTPFLFPSWKLKPRWCLCLRFPGVKAIVKTTGSHRCRP